MSDVRIISLLEQQQDRESDVALLRTAIGRESVTGNESNFADLLVSTLAEMDLSPKTGEFLPDRLNVWGSRTNDANGPNLMIIGHTDTVHVRGWADHWQDDPRKDPFAATLLDGEIWGRGACDLKAGICSALAGLRLLDSVGIGLAGDVSFAFVGDEESGEPGTGVSAGVKDLVRRIDAGQIKKPDFAIYVEPTKLDVYTAQIGFFIADITVTGKSAYFGTPEAGVDALKATHAILTEIWKHAEALALEPKHALVGGSDILVTKIDGGGYIAVPGQCRLSLIRKLRPGDTLDDAVQQFENAVHGAALQDGISVDITYPSGRDHALGGSPVEIDPDHPAAKLLSECVAGTSTGKGNIGGAPYWSENPFLVNAIGCPAVYCAPGDIGVAHTFEERVNVDEYLAAVRAFALFMTRYCGTTT